MRKDYMDATDVESGADEAAFVDRYWANVWKEHGGVPDLSRMAERDEYRVIAPYLATLPRGARILDAGCGLGEWTVFLSQKGFDVTGLDLISEVVDDLTAKFPQQHWVRGDLRHTTFADASFDAFFSWGAIEHFENGLGECLEEARRIVRPGGWIFVSVPFHNGRLLRRDRRALQHWDEQFDAQKGYTKPRRFYQWRLTRPELQRELEQHGFRCDAVVPIHKSSGAGRFLQNDLPIFAKNSRAYFLARRLLSQILPESFVSHMILAAGQRR